MAAFFLLLFVVNTDAGSFWRAEVLSQFDLYQLDTLSLSSPSLIFCLYNHLVTLYRYINTSLSLSVFSLYRCVQKKKKVSWFLLLYSTDTLVNFCLFRAKYSRIAWRLGNKPAEMSGTLSHKLRFHLNEAAARHNKALNLPRPKRDSNNQHRIRSPSAYQVSANLEKGGEEKKICIAQLQQCGVSERQKKWRTQVFNRSTVLDRWAIKTQTA